MERIYPNSFEKMSKEQIKIHLQDAAKQLLQAVDLLGDKEIQKEIPKVIEKASPIKVKEHYSEEEVEEEYASKREELMDKHWHSRPTWWKVLLVALIAWVILALVFRGDANPPEFVDWLFPW